MSKLRRRDHEAGERGAAAVEFGLILPLFIALTFGIIEFGGLFFSQIALTQAVREGVRVEALDTGEPAAVTTQAYFGFGTATFSSGESESCPDDGGGDDKARVVATVSDASLLGVHQPTLRGVAVMRCGG